jgi:Salmonella virulence plasmid 65kDa B protein/FG-GAP-like repeat
MQAQPTFTAAAARIGSHSSAFSRFIGVSLALCLGLIAAAASQAQTTVPGKIPGQFAVSPSGAATYSIPIQVPPGIAGMEPKLSLNYNSQAGNGMLGMGWSLGGFSSITRCPRTMVQDGVRGSVNNNFDDRFCLDGQRLMQVDANGNSLPQTSYSINNLSGYGIDGTQYRTELESFTRVSVDVGVPSAYGPSWFRAETKSGLSMGYGIRSSNLGALGSPSTRIWAVQNMSDIKGNSIGFTYLNDLANSELLPETVYYGESSNNKITFEYEPRPDVETRYQGGSVMKMTKRLKEIVTYTGTTAIQRTKLMYYQVGSKTQNSFLSSVQICDGAGASCLVPTNFAPFPASPAPLAELTNRFVAWSDAGGWSQPYYYSTIQYMDLNGDGLSDICARAADGLHCFFNTGIGWQEKAEYFVAWSDAIGWTQPQYYSTIKFVDLNGDGRTDMCARAAADGLHCYINTGTGWQESTGHFVAWTDANGWVQPHYYSTIQYMDLDGDGRTDMCARVADGLHCYINTGTGWQESTGHFAGWSDAIGWTQPQYYSTIKFVDLNGDGRADMCARAAADGLHCYINTGTGWQESAGHFVAWSDANGWVQPYYYSTIQYMDLNGDGLTDMCARAADGLHCYMNTGTRWQESTGHFAGWSDAGGWSQPYYYSTIRFVDLNGDGRADMCARAADGLHCYINTGTAWQESAGHFAGWSDAGGWSQPYYYSTIQYMDLNGDGLTDICARSADGLHCFQNTNLSDNKPLQLINSISTGTAKTNLAYVSINEFALQFPPVYTKDAGSNTAVYPKIDLQIPLYVVSKVRSDDGIGGVLYNDYFYAGLKAEQGTGRGMLGFRTQGVSAYGKYTVTEYAQDWPYIGMVKSATTQKIVSVPHYTGPGPVIGKITNTSACKIPKTGAVCPPPPPPCTGSWAPCAAAAAANALSGASRYFPHISSSLEESWDLNAGTALPSITTTTEYNINLGDSQLWGDPTKITITNAGDGSSKVIVNEYLPADTTKWILGRLKKATVTSIQP